MGVKLTTDLHNSVSVRKCVCVCVLKLIFKVMFSYLWLSCPHVCLPNIIISMFIQQLTEVIFPSIQSPVEICKQILIITLQQDVFLLLLFISSSCIFYTSVI
jgi:hypothetical protein